MPQIIRYYRRNAVLPQDLITAHTRASQVTVNPDVVVEAELGFYIEVDTELNSREHQVLEWLLAETFDPAGLSNQSFLKGKAVLEIGPRLNFETAWSSTAVAICHVNELRSIRRLERSRRFSFNVPLTQNQLDEIAAGLHDRMVETVYPRPLETFETSFVPQPVRQIPLIEEGMAALERENKARGLAMDDQDLQRFYDLFVNQLGRNPTDVELFQIGQANSEHCRHGFFKGKLFIDGKEQGESLMSIVKEPWRHNPNNSVIAFHDDSSAIKGTSLLDLLPEHPGAQPSFMQLTQRIYHPTLTAETHNFPAGVSPYPGAATGTGGRIRDNQAVGRGGMVVASGAGYCVGNLHIADHPWENDDHKHPPNLAAPVDILIEASNAASDYGNCFGEPLIYGFVRTFGMQLPSGYRSWFKPIMYSVGAGQIDDAHIEKGAPEAGMLVLQIGGPAYRIGMGGGAASSLLSGENAAALDFDAVQRGNPEMEQRLGRVLRACLELGDRNPIVSAHDLGAGGDANALPELVYPAGARIELRTIPVGDRSLSVLEIWGNESQERNSILIRPEHLDLLIAIAKREKAPLAVVGEVTGDGRLVIYDEGDSSQPVDLSLEPILGETVPKEVHLETIKELTFPLALAQLSVEEALERVLRLPSVSSKSYLTRKVDRCVTGHVAQQQCVGPNQLPLSNYAVIGQSLFSQRGVALSIGEQAIKSLIDPPAMARMAVAEAVLNLAGARITRLADIRCSANWMWAAKLPGEGAALHSAAIAMRDLMIKLGIAVDGGKDSLSMAVLDEQGEKIKAPGELVIAAYAPMEDVKVKVTPDLKISGNSLLLLDLSGGHHRLGGSALAQAWQQVGDEAPDLTDAELLIRAFAAVQELISNRSIVSLHDRSDGGLITTLLEMAFAGNVGLEVDLGSEASPLEAWFSEELGLVLEAPDGESVISFLHQHDIPATLIGQVGEVGGHTVIRHNGEVVVDQPMVELRVVWDETSTLLDRRQANLECVEEEAIATQRLVKDPKWQLSFTPTPTPTELLSATDKPKVAVIREQGSNGDREMSAAFYAAGFEVWDVTMTDLLEARVQLNNFRGVVFPGGFSYGDVLDAGKGWAGVIRFHDALNEEFERFYNRPDTFSLGVCNGAQLMALLGWVPKPGVDDRHQPRFIRNRSGRFECRLVTVEITSSPAVLLQGMEGSRLGVWVAHGEGRLHIPENAPAIDPGLVPMRFVDPDGNQTETYPFNPNGSPGGITALTSPDGRHLAMMPHPERTTNQMWQWPWLPREWQNLEVSPWLKLFQNAYMWCQDYIPAITTK